ncbi:exopolyphosphatase-like protein [Nemania serpens]|nr:exopolyphosphatase-like protein [Nemania serpens]
MPPRASLKTFLATARAALTAPPSKRTAPLTFVVGNESADLDSLCSALLLAYLHTYAPPKKRASPIGGGDGNGNGNENSSNSRTLHIPICHLYRADLALRPEFAAVLRYADVGGEDMFTLEDVLPPQNGRTVAASEGAKASRHQHQDQDAEKGKGKGERKGEGEEEGERNDIAPEDTRWLLVDHNEMTGPLASRFASRVVGCVDHHADEGVVPRDATPRVIEKSGSCASLVVERCAEIWEALGSAGIQNGSESGGKEEDRADEKDEVLEGAKIDAQLARVALAPILIDTSNLGDASKTTAHDEVAVALAEAKIAAYEELKTGNGDGVGASAVENKEGEGEGEGKGVNEKYDRAALFEHLSALKDDLDDMSFRDIFRKDYKEWSVSGLDLATSSIPRGFGYLLERKAGGDVAEMVAAIRRWGDERGMDLVVLLTTFVDDDSGEFSRELLVCARSEKGVRAAELFVERNGGELGLESWGGRVLDSGRDGEGEGEGEGEGGAGKWCRCWTQKAVEHSRKQIAPMLRDALKEVAGEK